MDYHYLAFFMGLFGSLHCVAMCGPLVLALPIPEQARWTVIANVVVYQIGRVLMYGGLGLFIGLIGHSLAMKGWQQGISLGVGILLVTMALFTLWGKHFHWVVHLQQAFFKPIMKWIGYWLHRPGGHFIVGFLNGLLPCGMVYMAMAASLSADTVAGAGLFMLLFGLGTWPAMLSVTIICNLAKRRIRINLSFWLPMIQLVIGGWFLMRGANLDVPYLSPLIYPEGAMMCH